MHNTTAIVVLIAVLGFGSWPEAAESPAKADFYVSVDGDDRWSGTLPVANAQSSDGPFATLARARDAVRELKRHSPGRDVLVLIRKGLYRLEKTVVFGQGDSGEGDCSVTYAAWPGERPVFSSGRPITGWRKIPGGVAGLPKTASGNVWVTDVSHRFFTLYDAEGLLPRARSAGFIPLPGGKKNVLRFPDKRLKNWPNLEDVEIVIRPHHAWIVNILPLASVDEEDQIARTAVDGTYALNPLHFLKGTESRMCSKNWTHRVSGC